MTLYETKSRPYCLTNKMLKGLLTINLLFLLALQPVGVAFARGGDLHDQDLPDNSAVFEIACEQINGDNCHVDTHCLVSAHAGCDLNPFQPVVHGSLISPVYTGSLSSDGLSKLPLNETFPPLRPPRHA